jgi:hypothetical protein
LSLAEVSWRVDVISLIGMKVSILSRLRKTVDDYIDVVDISSTSRST